MQFVKLISILTFATFSGVGLADKLATFSLKTPPAEAILEYGGKGEKLPLNKLVKLTLQLKSKEDLELTSFDAAMPAHNHGMVTKAQVKKITKNEFEISGVNLHMPGDWLFTIQIADGKGKLLTTTAKYKL